MDLGGFEVALLADSTDHLPRRLRARHSALRRSPPPGGPGSR